MDKDAVDREALAQAVLKFEWRPSDATMKEHAFNEEYRSARFFRDDSVRRDWEGSLHVLYCRACLKLDGKTHNVRAIRLYIAVENDPLGNCPAMFHSLCYNCGWEVYVNLPRDPRKSAQDEIAQALRMQQELERRHQQLANIRAIQQSAPSAVDPKAYAAMIINIMSR